MGNFNKFGGDRGGRDFGGRGFGGGRKFGGQAGGPRQMHQATCSKCGQDCEVPFRPTGERPVFCSNCFKNQGGPDNRFARKSFGGASVHAGIQGGISKEQFAALSVKLDKILSILAIAKPIKAEAIVNEPAAEEKKKKETAKKKAIAPAKKVKARKK